MPELPPVVRDEHKIDAGHLNLLSIFHFVGSGLAALAMLFLLVHFLLFRAFFANPTFWQGQHQTPPPLEFFAVFKWLYLIMGIWLLASCAANVISALCIRAGKCRVFSMVVAGLNCLYMPLGTALGVFTLIVLLRPSVQELYEGQSR